MFNVSVPDTQSIALISTGKDIRQQILSRPQSTLHSTTHILNLPIELKQKIALRLSSKDYSSLRESCLAMSLDIDSFSVLNNRLALNFKSNEHKDKIKKMILNQSIRMFMSEWEWRDVSETLKNIRINKSHALYGTLFVNTLVPTQRQKREAEYKKNECCPDWASSGFLLFKNEISKVAEGAILHISKKKHDKLSFWKIDLSFKNEFIHYSQLKTVFLKLNDVIQKTNGAEKLLIAAIADKLKAFWCQNIPHGLVRDNINESAKEADVLFMIADEIKCVWQENIR